MLRAVDDEQRARERAARLEARNARRRADGKSTFLWPGDADETVVIAPHQQQLRGEPSGSETTKLQSGEPEPQAGEAPTEGAARRKLARSTAIFGIATGLSRVLGLVREMVASYYFGASGRINAFTIAFQVPNLVRALVADAALSSAAVDMVPSSQQPQASSWPGVGERRSPRLSSPSSATCWRRATASARGASPRASSG